jgi:serine/threonine-protein kinase
MAFGLRQGDVFAGRYRVERMLAAGGMGAVYEVLHLDTQRRRALKVMLPHVLDNDEMRERFKREALVAAGIESEFIVDVFDAGVDDETRMPFLVMELLRGEELGKRIKRLGRMDPAEAVGYLHQTARALDKMHRASLVHRDLKPENIFLAEREDGPSRVKLLDFGVAKVVAEAGSAAGATEVVGTPSYMAPEQFHTGTRITAAADVYALGLTAFTLLVGTAYWYDETTSGNAFAVALSAARGPSEPASVRAARRGAGLPPGFDAWFATVTAMEPGHRYATAGAAIRALAQVLGVGLSLTTTTEGLPVVDPTTGGDSRPPGPPSDAAGALPNLGLPSFSATVRQPSRPWRPALLAVAMMVLGGGLAIVFLPGSSGPTSAAVPKVSAEAPLPTAAGVPVEPRATAPTPTAAAPDAGAHALPAGSASAAAAPISSAKAPPVPKSTPRARPSAVYSQE